MTYNTMTKENHKQCNGRQNTTQKTKDLATRTTLITYTMISERVNHVA